MKKLSADTAGTAGARIPSRTLSSNAGARIPTRTLACLSSFLPWVLCALCGCGLTGGEMLYWSGLVPSQKIKAKYELGKGPLLILIDDPDDLVHWPQILTQAGDLLHDELIDKKAAEKVLPADTAARLRTSHPDFDERGCREIGRLAEADQVLWLEVRDFYASEQMEDLAVAAKITVSVKVMNAIEEKDRSKVRLWPPYPDGERVSVELNPSEVVRAKVEVGVTRHLAQRLADQVAKLFYTHREDDSASKR